MSNVNADLNELLQVVNNMKTAINSIEITKSSIEKTYQQLGNEWKDKKYKELGDIVQECKKALNDILKTLLKGESFVSKLCSGLREYEEIQLGTSNSEHSNSFVTSLRSFVRVKSEKDKTTDFKTGLKIIDERIENYAESLRERGLQNGVVMNAILNNQRYLEEAELLRNINGDFSNPTSPPNYDAIIENCRSSNLMNYSAEEPLPRALQSTRYGFTNQTINGMQMRVYNDPVGTNSLLIEQQGNSHYDMGGTCGLCQCSNLLTMAGVSNSSEDRVISAAMHCSDNIVECMELFNSDEDERGGTTTLGRQEILESCGLSTYNLPISVDRNQTTNRLAREIQTGHGVIVSVDVARLWRNGQSGGHAISLISVTEDGNTFIYNDTGSGRMGTISATELGLALTGRPANVTTNIIR